MGRCLNNCRSGQFHDASFRQHPSWSQRLKNRCSYRSHTFSSAVIQSAQGHHQIGTNRSVRWTTWQWEMLEQSISVDLENPTSLRQILVINEEQATRKWDRNQVNSKMGSKNWAPKTNVLQQDRSQNGASWRGWNCAGIECHFTQQHGPLSSVYFKALHFGPSVRTFIVGVHCSAEKADLFGPPVQIRLTFRLQFSVATPIVGSKEAGIQIFRSWSDGTPWKWMDKLTGLGRVIETSGTSKFQRSIKCKMLHTLQSKKEHPRLGKTLAVSTVFQAPMTSILGSLKLKSFKLLNEVVLLPGPQKWGHFSADKTGDSSGRGTGPVWRSSWVAFFANMRSIKSQLSRYKWFRMQFYTVMNTQCALQIESNLLKVIASA